MVAMSKHNKPKLVSMNFSYSKRSFVLCLSADQKIKFGFVFFIFRTEKPTLLYLGHMWWCTWNHKDFIWLKECLFAAYIISSHVVWRFPCVFLFLLSNTHVVRTFEITEKLVSIFSAWKCCTAWASDNPDEWFCQVQNCQETDQVVPDSNTMVVDPFVGVHNWSVKAQLKPWTLYHTRVLRHWGWPCHEGV